MSMIQVFLPMTIWQALAFLRNRSEMPARMTAAKKPERAPLPGELVVGDELVGYQTRSAAIEAGQRTTGGELALVEISYSSSLHEALAYRGQVNGTHCDPESGASLWKFTAGGFEELDRQARFVMEVVSNPAAAKPVSAPTVREFGGGPTGWGGC